MIDRCCYIKGPEVRAFEEEMARWLGVDEVCGVSCATSGLWAALTCLGIGPGDDVVTTVHTAIATSEAIRLAGANVVFADIDPDTYNLDPEDVRRRITANTKALLVVHLYGQPADLGSFQAIAEEEGLLLIEDCAQAQGARHRDRRVGTFGDAAVFSFFPSKPLGGFGDGGAVVAKDPGVLERVRMFCDHGRSTKYWHEFEATNNRLDAMQAAMLRVALRELDRWNELRREAASWYDTRLSGIEAVKRPVTATGCEGVFHLYVVSVPDRDALAAHLESKGISTGVHYPYSLNALPAYAHLKQGEGSFPNAEWACAHVLSLPLFPGITEAEVDHVSSAIAEYFAG